jgi:hypothetical protein
MWWINWIDKKEITGQSYVCGFCGRYVGPSHGYLGEVHDGTRNVPNPKIYICPNCQKPTFRQGEEQVPAPVFGNPVSSMPTEVGSLYDEARRCMSVSAYTAAVLLCRKLLMHIAVEKGAEEGKPFIEYVEYLSNKGYVPPDGKGWVDHIRDKGNEANHEIAEVGIEDAKDLISFSEMLLRFVFELPSRIPRKS